MQFRLARVTITAQRTLRSAAVRALFGVRCRAFPIASAQSPLWLSPRQRPTIIIINSSLRRDRLQSLLFADCFNIYANNTARSWRLPRCCGRHYLRTIFLIIYSTSTDIPFHFQPFPQQPANPLAPQFAEFPAFRRFAAATASRPQRRYSHRHMPYMQHTVTAVVNVSFHRARMSVSAYGLSCPAPISVSSMIARNRQYAKRCHRIAITASSTATLRAPPSYRTVREHERTVVTRHLYRETPM